MSAESIALTLVLWAGFGLQHSLLAQAWFKDRVARLLGRTFVDFGYRFVYFVLQCFVYPAFWFVVSHLEPGGVLWSIPESWYPLQHGVRVVAHFFLLMSVLSVDVNLFIGTKQLARWIRARLTSRPLPPVAGPGDVQLVTRFPFNIVRHPMYLGILLSLLGSTAVFTEKAVLNIICLVAYLEIGTYYEERQLVRFFGDGYADYRRRVPKYLPLPKLAFARRG